MRKVIKSARITIPRKDAILAVKKDLHFTLPLYDWCDVVWIEEYTQEEIEAKEKYDKALSWYNLLSAEDKEHYKVIASSMHPHAIG